MTATISLVTSYRLSQRLIEIAYDIVCMFDPNAEPNHLGADAGLPLLLGRHLAMGC